MKILIAPDKFKGSLSAQQVCEAIAEGILSADNSLQVKVHPLADGGDGSLEVLDNHFELEKITCSTVDSLGRAMQAQYLVSSAAGAFIEVAAASGMVLLQPEERNPMKTSSLGTGILIADALQRGVQHINLLLGGSATNDAGTGILQALGYQFLDEEGATLSPNGETLFRIRKIVPPADSALQACTFSLLCDVTNPFSGTNGAAHIFAHQKGANNAMVQQLDDGLKSFAKVITATTGVDVTNVPGAGAAGGIGGGLVGLLGAEIISGTQQFIHLTGFEKLVTQHDVIITGEGSLDQQSLNGKVVDGVATLARKHGKKLVLVSGINQLSTAQAASIGADLCMDIMSMAPSQEAAMGQAGEYLRQIGQADFSESRE